MQMLSKLHTLIFTLALGCLAVGCNDAVDSPDTALTPGAPGTITIRFQNSTASRNAASDNSETLIQTLTVCLYDDPVNDDALPVYTRSFTPNENNATTVVMGLSDELIDKLFPAGTTTCRMYAVANVAELPAELTVNNIKNQIVTSDFYTQDVQTSFAMAGECLVYYTPPVSDTEKGKAEGDGKLYRTAAKIRLNLRLPEKIEIKDKDGNVTETWTPQTAENAIRVLLNNGVQKAPIVPADGWEPAEEDNDAYYSSNESDPNGRQSYRSFRSGLGTETYPYGMQVPFYTYPNAWVESETESHKTSLTLMVPWKKNNTDQYQSLYYQVPVVPGTLSSLTSNYAYTINLNVGKLGSPNPDTSVEVTDLTYQVVDWANQTIDVNINDYRYLVVNPNYYVANNESQIVIPFYTSHPVDFENIDITYQRFNFYSNGNGDVVEIEIDKDQIDASNQRNANENLCTYSIQQNATTGQMSVVINHSLDMWRPMHVNANNTTRRVYLTGHAANTLDAVTDSIDYYEKITPAEGAYSPYVIKVKIHHKDNTAFAEDIEIVQYPAMYIQADRNTGGSYVVAQSFFGYIYGTTTSNLGYVYVNPKDETYQGTPYIQNDDGLGGVHGLTGYNTNPNMYVITISQLNASSTGPKYIIGDPRSKYVNNSLSGENSITPTADETSTPSWSNPGNVVYPSTSSAKRGLRYYYPTYEYSADDPEAYLVAPKIRVASSWGVCSQGRTREQARRRCATYQEQGFPAGRWRLPTLGEFTYITQLSSTGKIPVLFSEGSNYLTAQGFYQVNDGVVSAGTNSEASVRAVYDEWYWENLEEYAMPKNQNGGYDYTLGDVPRQ